MPMYFLPCTISLLSLICTNFTFINVYFVGAFVSLLSLSIWHARLISRGETSIEANINKAEMKRLATFNKVSFIKANFCVML